MVQGGFPGDPSEAEKVRYRRKLAEWRAMGFDVSALEVLLETDFEKFKEKRFELMRSQIHGAGPAPHAGPERPPVAVIGQQPVPARRPGLHSHFVRPSRAPEEPPVQGDAPAQPERFHSEMRYPSARRTRPERPVRTFSVEAGRERDAGKIVVAGTRRPVIAARAAPPRKVAGAAPGGAAPALRTEREARPREERPEVAVLEGERPVERLEMAVEEEDASEGVRHLAREGEEDIVLEEEYGGPAEGAPEEDAGLEEEPPEERPAPGDEAVEEQAAPRRGRRAREAVGEGSGAGQEEPAGEEEQRSSLGYFIPASRVPMKPRERPAPPARTRAPGPARLAPGGGEARAGKRKLRKVALAPRPGGHGRRPSYGWIAVAAVALLVLCGFAGYTLLQPGTKLVARASFPATAEAGALVTFDGANSSTTGKGIVSYEWTFGDGARGAGRRTTHFYSTPGTVTVALTVKDQDGTRSSPYRSRLTVNPLAVAVPAKRLNDRASYAVNGTVDISNPDTFLYKINLAGQQITVSQVQLGLTGTMGQWVRDQHPEEDGFGIYHSALWTTGNEALSIFGKAFTSLGTVTLSGDLNYFEESYSDAATGAVFQVQSRARTSLRLSSLPPGPTSINSTDSLRAYPGTAGMSGQFLPENVYKGRTFSQTDGQANGTHTSGNVTYLWARMGVRNIGGMASLGLNITAEKAYLDKNGFSEFYLNLWISGSSSMPTSTFVHVKGRSGDTSYTTEHLTTMTEFKAGSGAVDARAQYFEPAPLPEGLFSRPFVDVPAAGPGNTSLRFSPEQAVQEAARDGAFSDFLSRNPQAYAVAAKYYEGQFGPGSATWNLTFSWPNAPSAYWVNVTRDIAQKYTVRGEWDTSPPESRTAEGALARLLTMSSAEGRMRDNDTETATAFFKGGAVNWTGGTSLELESDPVYPGINLASMYAAGERAGYGVMLRKEGNTSAFAMDTGQMMYFYTHSGV